MKQMIVKVIVKRVVVPAVLLAALVVGGMWLYGYLGCGRYLSILDRASLNSISADGYDTAAKGKLGL